MSHIVYGQNKFICNFQLSSSIKDNVNKFFRVNQLVLLVHHFQYPCVFYEEIYNHFKNHLPQKVNKNQIRIYYNKIELPSDVPIGLYINQKCQLQVNYSQFQIAEPYQLLFSCLKRAFSGVNGIKGCDYILKKLNKQQQMLKVKDYFQGRSHNLQHQNYVGYEGTHIMIKFFVSGQLIERRAEVSEGKTIIQLINELLPKIRCDKCNFFSHGIQVNLKMSTKVFLDELSYNDGYCYIQIVQNMKD